MLAVSHNLKSLAKISFLLRQQRYWEYKKKNKSKALQNANLNQRHMSTQSARELQKDIKRVKTHITQQQVEVIPRLINR